jgi:glycosyltransferase involved in cell wall biosynthesis
MTPNGEGLRVVYWNYMPAPYMVDRFNALVRREELNFEAWFSARREPHWSGAWEVNESQWEFQYRYIPSILVRGRSIGFPPQLLSKSRPSVLVSPHGEPAFVASWLAARRSGVRTAFWVVHTFDSMVPRVGWKERLKHYMFRRTDAIFVPGEDARSYALRYGAPIERILTVPHPVASDFVGVANRASRGVERSQLRAKLGLNGVTFLYAGRLWWGKGLNYLLDAFATVQNSTSQLVNLLLVGDGPDQKILEERCQELGITNVVFAGFQQRYDLPRYYSAADVFVFPTLGEPFGLVVGEAMSCGLPAISTTAAGEIHDRIEDGVNGYTIPPANSSAMAHRMLKLVEDQDLRDRMGKAAAHKVARCTPDRWGIDFKVAIERVMELPQNVG